MMPAHNTNGITTYTMFLFSLISYEAFYKSSYSTSNIHYFRLCNRLINQEEDAQSPLPPDAEDRVRQ